ncbi:hypothetical protein ACFX15_035333 [Malus domestica]
MQAVKQAFQDLGASSLQSAHDLLKSSILRLGVRTGASQVEGGVHGLVSYEKKSFCLLYLFSFSHPAGDCGLGESSVFHSATNILPI